MRQTSTVVTYITHDPLDKCIPNLTSLTYIAFAQTVGQSNCYLAEHGQRLDSVQRVVGHRDSRSTQLYADMAEYQVPQAIVYLSIEMGAV